MLRSLELNWLHSEIKGVSLPNFVFAPITHAGGEYWHPAPREQLIGSRFYDLRRGLIVVSTLGDTIAGAIAHEFRHHWQKLQGWPFDASQWEPATTLHEYDRAIVRFFLDSRTEWDALRFERRKARNWLNEHWVSLLKGGTNA